MLDNDTVRAIAARLHEAERTRQQIRQISLEYPDITIADAYAIQRPGWTSSWPRAGSSADTRSA